MQTMGLASPRIFYAEIGSDAKILGIANLVKLFSLASKRNADPSHRHTHRSNTLFFFIAFGIANRTIRRFAISIASESLILDIDARKTVFAWFDNTARHSFALRFFGNTMRLTALLNFKAIFPLMAIGIVGDPLCFIALDKAIII